MINNMIAIHCRTNSYSDRWIHHCEVRGIDYIGVNIYDSDVISLLQKNKVTVLLAHIDQDDYRTRLISNSILLSIEKLGIRVYPDFNSFWHFDDKISQKYLFEVLNIPHVPTYVFYDREEAKAWLSKAKFPLVFKLRGGAASQNVFLLKDYHEAKRYLDKMFTRGMKPVRSPLHDFKRKVRRHSAKADWTAAIKRLPATIRHIINSNSEMSIEKGYFLVQDFIPGNDFDYRITIIGEKAFAFRRINRPGDFRASGSGVIDHTYQDIFKPLIALGFETAGKIGSKSLVFDILIDQNGKPCIVEISYISITEPIYKTGGYWDSSLVFHKRPLGFEDAVFEHVLELNN
jgi:glutathione synthase/RimK-type ligase-like ATP-grasp enzyme